MQTQSHILTYGRDRTFEFDIAPERLAAVQSPPAEIEDVSGAIEDALNRPIDFPPLRQSVFPEDKIVLALDRRVPHAGELISGIWQAMQSAGVNAADVTILQPTDNGDDLLADPRSQLPDAVREAIGWIIHEPNGEGECGYLASSASGDRIYLSRRVIDADVVITVGQIAYDPIIGYRGTNSVFYPGLSDEDAARRARGIGHSELGPDDNRPMRVLIDEIGWLLGNQLTVQTLPAAGNGASHVLTGLSESVFRQGKQMLSEEWLLRLSTRSDLVIATVDGGTGENAWRRFGAALNVARKVVTRNGRIVLLTDLNEELGDGLQCVRESAEPADALKPLQSFAPSDFLPATQLANAAGWANISLVSGLDAEIVEDLFMTPVQNDDELRRLLEGDESCVLIESAQSAGCQLG